MKTFYLLTAAVLFSYFSQAQPIKTGQKILGGALVIGFNSNKTDTSTFNYYPQNRYLDFYLSPSFGRAVRENLVFGYKLNLGFSNQTSELPVRSEEMRVNYYQLGGGVFAEKFFPIKQVFSFSILADATVNYQSSTQEGFKNNASQNKTTGKAYGIGIGASPSFNYALNQKFLLQLFLNDFISVGYSKGSAEIKSNTGSGYKQSTSSFGFNTALNNRKALNNVGFSFRYIF